VDWDAPLTLISGATSSDADTSAAAGGKLEGRSYGAGEDTSSGLAEVSAAASAIKVVDPGEMQRVHAAARLGLRFADAAIDAGSMDAARTALGVLVRFAPLLPARLLGDLVAAMGRCRMTESTRNLAAAAVVARPGSSLQDPEVASLLAALAGGVQGEAVHGTLQSSGLAPLSAVFAAVWGVGNSEAAMEKWKAQVAGRGYGEVEVSIVPPTM